MIQCVQEVKVAVLLALQIAADSMMLSPECVSTLVQLDQIQLTTLVVIFKSFEAINLYSCFQQILVLVHLVKIKECVSQAQD